MSEPQQKARRVGFPRDVIPSGPILTLTDEQFHNSDSALYCEFCGEHITANPQKCMALDDGWCRP